MVEFGNRVVAVVGILAALVTWLASRRVDGLPRWVRRAALAAFLGTIAQIPLGGLTVILDLHPLAVMSHFLLALVVVALAVVVAGEAWGHARGRGAPVAPRWLRLVALVGVVGVRGDGRHRRRRHGVRAAPGRGRRGRPPRDRDPRHRLRPRPRDGGLRDRLPARRLAADPGPARGARRPAARRGAARGARAADARRRDPVPERPPVGARARPRDARRDDLGPHRGARPCALAAAPAARRACTRARRPARAGRIPGSPRRLRCSHGLAGPPHRAAADASPARAHLGVPRVERRGAGGDRRRRVPRAPLGRRAVRGHRSRGVHRLPGGAADRDARRGPDSRGSSGRRTRSSTGRSRAPSATRSSSSASSRTTAGARSPTSWSGSPAISASSSS